MDKKIITVAELAKKYSLGMNFAYQLARTEGFPMIKTGRKINILADKVDEWLEKNIGKQF